MSRLLLLLALAAPALAQPGLRASYVTCDPSATDSGDAAAACDFDLPPDAPAARANRALVAQLYADLARNDLAAVAAVLSEHVLWVERTDGGRPARTAGASTVAARVLPPLGASRLVLDHVTADGPDRVVAAGTVAPPTGLAAPFRTVWRLLDGRIVGVEHTVGAGSRGL